MSIIYGSFDYETKSPSRYQSPYTTPEFPLQPILPTGGFTFRSAGVGAQAGSSPATVTLTGVVAGDVVVVVGEWQYNGAGTCSGTDGTHTDNFTALTYQYDASGKSMQVFYLLSSTASGSVTYSVTQASANYLNIIAFDYASSSAASLDTSAQATGVAGTPDSGAITTAGYDIVVGAIFDNNPTSSVPQIGGATPTDSTKNDSGPNIVAFCSSYSTIQTNIHATGSAGTSGNWEVTILAIKN